MTSPLSPKHSFNRSLARKISEHSIVVLLALFVVFMAYDFFEVRYSLQRELDAYADQVSSRLSTSLSYPVWNIDWVQAEAIMRAEIADPRLACLVLNDSVYGKAVSLARQDGTLSKRSNAQACEPHAGSIERTVTLRKDDTPIGAVRVVMDSGYVQRNLLEHLVSNMIEDLILLLALTAALSVFTRKLLLQPVATLTKTIQAITKDKDYSVRAIIPSRDELGNLAHCFNTMLEEIGARDSTIRNHSKNLELEVAERTEELTQKARDLEYANARLREVDQLKSAFLSTVSHDLRTPLTSILGFSKLIAKDFDTSYGALPESDAKRIKRRDRIRKNLSIIFLEGERLTRLINDFLDLSKIESGRMVWRNQAVKIGGVVEQAVDAVQGQFDALPGVDLRLSLDDALPVVICDPDRLLQVLANLLNNAAKFTSEGSVEVRVRNAGGNLRIEVADSGQGIPPDRLERIFNKFYKGDDGDTLPHNTVGTGLGLAICKEIVQHYNGRIWAESEVGKGATFIVELPGRKNAASAKEAGN